jgi:transposase
MTTGTVLVGRERRRRWTTSEKLRLVEESFAPGASVAEVARRHEVHPNQLHGWRKEARSGSLSITPGPQACFAAVEIADQVALPAPAVIPEAPASLIIEVVLRNGRLVRSHTALRLPLSSISTPTTDTSTNKDLRRERNSEVVFDHRVEAACLLQLVVAVDGGFLDHLIQLSGGEVHVHGSLWISARGFCSGGDEHANLRAELMLPVYLRRLSTSKGAARRFC